MTTVGYIGGLGRSGSTLLERIAAGLRGVAVLGEVVHVWSRGVLDDELCGCGERFSSCPFWQPIGDLAFGGWSAADAREMVRLQEAVDRTRHLRTLTRRRPGAYDQAAVEYVARFDAVHEAAARVADAPVVIDSSKHASTAFLLYKYGAADLRVVHMVRDSRGVAYSWTKEMRRPEAATGSSIELMHRYRPWQAAVQWNAQNLAFEWLARRGAPTWQLRYEHLLADPVRATEQLAEFLGAGDQDIAGFVSADQVNVGPAHQIAGNPMRFRTGALALRRDDEWRSAMGLRDRRTVTALTAPLMHRYGYRPGGAGDG